MNILEMMKTNIAGATIPEQYKSLSVKEMEERVSEIRARLGKRLFIPGHHYQKDEVIKFADATGDSLKLAQLSAENTDAEFIVFCGVHFMAETADILTTESQKVFLPDMRAGCSMADMADINQTQTCWSELQEIFGDTILPLTYVNSTAAIKAFVGKNGGATVTSSNAKKMLQWAFTQKERILFLPDQHLGRNTAQTLGIPLDKMAVWDPIHHTLGYKGKVEDIQIILWKGHCSVHENFTPTNVENIRKTKPEMNIIVHPECPYETVALADYAGSTAYIIEMIEKAPSGSKWAIGTEMNLVQRIITQHPDKEIISLNPHLCACLTMNRIDLPHLTWSLEMIERRELTQHIKVPDEIAQYAIFALNRMLQRA